MIRFFHYVPHHRIPEFEAGGWIVVSDLGLVHGHYAVLMQWTGEGEP